MPRQTTGFIAIHCSDTKPNMDIGAKEIRQWHVAPPPKGRGWADIGYNFIIRRDGTIEPGRDLDHDGDNFEEIGAHVEGFNSRSVGICMVGGMDYVGKPDNNFTPEQFKSLATLVRQTLHIYPGAVVQGHRDFPGVKKACPCFDVKAWWKSVNS